MARLQSERVTLECIDAPWNFKGSQHAPNPTENNKSERYLEFISRVLQQTKRVLSKAGSLYFHSEPRMQGDTRLILDTVFGQANFRAEIIWPRRLRFDAAEPRNEHDTILLYSKTGSYIYNRPLRPLSDDEVRRYHYSDDRGPYSVADLTRSAALPHLQFDWKGYVLPPRRSWRYPKEELDRLDKEGRIHRPRNGLPKRKVYLEEHPGVEVGSIWADISRLSPYIAENPRYPGQRPPALLERIVSTGSNEGDTVLDPFCGTGTALVAAQASGRRWIGCDLSAEACSITAARLEKTFGLQRQKDFLLLDQSYVEQFPPIERSYPSLMTGANQRKEEVLLVRGPFGELGLAPPLGERLWS
jgi:DNA modification methylase